MKRRNTQRSRDAVLTHWVGAALRGLTSAETAEQLGMSRDALRRAVLRARRDGDPRAISNAPFVVIGEHNWHRERDSRGWFIRVTQCE